MTLQSLQLGLIIGIFMVTLFIMTDLCQIKDVLNKIKKQLDIDKKIDTTDDNSN